MSRPLFLRGKVVLDPGGVVPEAVSIERVCNGRTRRETYTDSHGNFSFQWGMENGVLQDASDNAPTRMAGQGGSTNVSQSQLWNCELQANLPGYTSSVISLAGRDLYDTSEVGTIVLHRIGGIEGNSISVVSLQAPGNAKKEMEKGTKDFHQSKYADAEKHLKKAVEIYPKYATAWELLGETQQAQKQTDDAVKSFGAAIQADDKFVPPYMRIAQIDASQQKWPEVVDWTGKVISLDPRSYPMAHFLQGVANFNLQHIDEAQRSALKTLELDKQHDIPIAELLMAKILQVKGDRPGAVEHFKAYLALVPSGPQADEARTTLSRIDPQAAATAPAPKQQ